MSLRTLLATANAVAQHKLDGLRDKPSAGEDKHPLDLGFNRLLTFDEVPFLLWEDKGLQLSCPGQNLTILAHGRVDLADVTWHRYHLSDERSLLQIGVDREGRLLEGEMRLFQDVDEITPASPDEWEFWLGEEDGYIGHPAFQSRDQRFLYQRVWMPSPARAKPLRFQEQLYTGPQDRRSFPVFHSAMLYGRVVGEEMTEFLLVDAVEQQHQAWVEIQVGMPLAPHQLQIT